MTITTYEFSLTDLQDLIDGLSDDETYFIDDSLTLIYTDYDNPHENYIDDYNYNLYLDSEGTYIEIGYNYSKDRQYTSHRTLDRPSLPPLQGPLWGPDGMEFLPISYLIFQNEFHLSSSSPYKW